MTITIIYKPTGQTVLSVTSDSAWFAIESINSFLVFRSGSYCWKVRN